MFESLTSRLGVTFNQLFGKSKLDESNIQAALQEVRAALLDADVALPAIQLFLDEVKSKAIGVEIEKSFTAEQRFIKVVREALVHLLGSQNEPLNFRVQPPAVILMAGLQGSGKTTTSAKLARLLKEQHKKKAGVVSCDVYRPAAILQLETLANDIGIPFIPSHAEENPVDIAKRALQQAKTQGLDVLIIDTAGRLHIDLQMMDEIKAIHAAVNPIETLFVVDAMTGQDAANTAKAFHDALSLTGVVLTKLDGDARGGAAMSVKTITGKPIKFVGVGEKTDKLEAFHPDRMASLILGMGDVLTLVEEIERKVDKEKAEKLAKKITSGRGFNFNDLREQLTQMMNMGGIGTFLEKLPGLNQMPAHLKEKANDKEFKRMIAIINSMTKRERIFPNLIAVGSRKKRIAEGSGTTIQDVNRLIKQFEQMEKMMKKFSKMGGMKNMMRGLQNMMPPGGRFF